MRAERHVHHRHAERAGFALPAEAMLDAWQKTCASAVTLGAEWNAKVAAAMRQNLAAGFELAGDLATAKTLPELIEVSTAHARRQTDAALAQNRELWSLGQKLMSEAAQPMTGGLAKCLGPEASS